MQRGHTAWTCNVDMHHRQAAWPCNMNMQHVQINEIFLEGMVSPEYTKFNFAFAKFGEIEISPNFAIFLSNFCEIRNLSCILVATHLHSVGGGGAPYAEEKG
jgi:hypothetical protein